MNVSVRRRMCATCLRPQATCICQWITAIDPVPEVVILQHPLEEQNAKGSARLLHLCLSGSHIYIGEQFIEKVLRELLNTSGKQSILLYPDTPEQCGVDVLTPPALDARLLAQPDKLRLIIVDATWRKSRKMLYLNPALQQLPRLALQYTADSLYRIRKAHKPDQLSSLEATCYALSMLEQSHEKYLPLLATFDGFVRQQEDLRITHQSGV